MQAVAAPTLPAAPEPLAKAGRGVRWIEQSPWHAITWRRRLARCRKLGGGAAIINQDGSVNTPSNPASAGDTISLYGTGDGEEDPIPVTGGVSPAGLTNSLHFISVTIGGIRAQVSYRGGAPSAVSGLFQIYLVVPAGLTPGNQPVVAQYDSVTTQASLTLAVK